MIQFNNRVKKSEPGLQKVLKNKRKMYYKIWFFFKYMNIFIYFSKI